MLLKTQLQLRNFMINFMDVLLQFGSFDIHFMKIQLNFILLIKVSENSVHFSQFQDTFTQKHHIIVKFYVTT